MEVETLILTTTCLGIVSFLFFCIIFAHRFVNYIFTSASTLSCIRYETIEYGACIQNTDHLHFEHTAIRNIFFLNKFDYGVGVNTGRFVSVRFSALNNVN